MIVTSSFVLTIGRKTEVIIGIKSIGIKIGISDRVNDVGSKLHPLTYSCLLGRSIDALTDVTYFR